MISPGQLSAAGLWVTSREGPYHVDPLDPGGATSWGISIRYHKEFTDAQLRALTQTDAAAFLVKNYWPDHAEDLPDFLAIPLLSFSVLEGPTQAVMCLQRALVVHVDGGIGPQTIHAANLPTQEALLESYFGACMDRLHGRADWIREGTGWERRQFAASLKAQKSTGAP